MDRNEIPERVYTAITECLSNMPTGRHLTPEQIEKRTGIPYLDLIPALDALVAEGRIARDGDDPLYIGVITDDWCEETVYYVTPEDPGAVHPFCEELHEAGAIGISADGREVVATWKSKRARARYEERLKWEGAS